MKSPQLIVMLTYNDLTLGNACEIFEECKDSKADFWGFKEEGIPHSQMKKLFSRMKECGKTTVLEVVAYNEAECIKGAETALECGCDFLMGTVYFDSVNDFCKKNGIRYMPFVGDVSGRPSVLEGTCEDMIDKAEKYISKGVFGVDFLGYRYKDGDCFELTKEFISEIDAPVCIAGSVNTFGRLDEILQINPWGFTIGSAFVEKRFGDDFCEQINRVYDYINK